MDFFNFLRKKPKEVKKIREEAEALYLYFQCEKCGEKIQIRVNKQTDLQREEGMLYLNKEILGNRCLNLIYTSIQFDSRYRILSAEVERGKLISEKEFSAPL